LMSSTRPWMAQRFPLRRTASEDCLSTRCVGYGIGLVGDMDAWVMLVM